jgi:hypothetical protein
MNNIWFCRACKKRGSMNDMQIGSIFLAQEEHRLVSPECSAAIRSVDLDSINGEQKKEIEAYELAEESF